MQKKRSKFDEICFETQDKIQVDFDILLMQVNRKGKNKATF